MRYNIFNEVYKPLKVSLLNSCIALSNNENTTAGVSAEIVAKVKDALRLCDEQVKFETINILPLIFEYEPAIWDVYTRAHHKVRNMQIAIEGMIKTFSGTSNEIARVDLLASIAEAFNRFVMLNYNHMDEEEAVLNEILWRYYPDEALMQIQEESNVVHTLLTHGTGKYRTAKAA